MIFVSALSGCLIRENVADLSNKKIIVDSQQQHKASCNAGAAAVSSRIISSYGQEAVELMLPPT